MPRHHPTPDEAATKIQATFRGYSTRKHIQEEKKQISEMSSPLSPTQPDPNLAATKIQATYRGYRTRKELGQVVRHPDVKIRHSEPIEQLRISHEERHARGLSDISSKSTLWAIEDEEERRNLAATRIQAAFRGYYVRSHLAESERSGDSSPYYSPHISEDEAATKIQAAFRGYRVRKNMRSQTSPIHRYHGQQYDEAARKIQANYRGYRVRKEIGSLKQHQNTLES
ncbi:hypothetical protein Aperf_G00000076685 [Anoplocephala perfoliata]